MVDFNDIDQSSSLYSEDLAPIPISRRTWGMWDMAAIWVGMAVCIPTYLLASYMIKSGLNWIEALVIIAVGNIIITVPMVLNGHAGVKYGVPFPVIGRASFGTRGIHLAAVVRGIVACGWFGIQTWIGGLAFYAIWHGLMGTSPASGIDFGKFVGFALFWILNVYFIWKGTESIKWLEKFAAPILIGIGILLIIWGVVSTGGFTQVLRQSSQLAQPAALIESTDDRGAVMKLFAVTDADGNVKADEYQLTTTANGVDNHSEWQPVSEYGQEVELSEISIGMNAGAILDGSQKVNITYRDLSDDGGQVLSSAAEVQIGKQKTGFWNRIWSYLLWLTAMVGFWATMAISIADITRFTPTQSNQVKGQFIGLPGTMALFSFVGIFVTCAAVIIFPDILIAQDAPWDPVTLLGRFSNPFVVIIAQIFMIIATLSTNIAANVIAPANAFSNLNPARINFRIGGVITAIIGIIICPWWLLDEISSLLLFVSSFLGPVLGIIICDYFLVRNKTLNVKALFLEKGEYSFGGSGFNPAAMIALAAGVVIALIGLWVPALSFLYTLSWFTGFGVAFALYYLLMKKR